MNVLLTRSSKEPPGSSRIGSIQFGDCSATVCLVYVVWKILRLVDKANQMCSLDILSTTSSDCLAHAEVHLSIE